MATPDPAAVPAETWGALDALFRSDPYAARLGAELVSWEPGTATVAWTPAADQVNFAGGVHGGAIFSVADLAFSFACNGWGRACVALSVTVEFLAAPALAAELTVVAVERSRGRTIGAYGLSVTAPDGRLVASLSALAFRTPRWHLGEERWPEAWRTAV